MGTSMNKYIWNKILFPTLAIIYSAGEEEEESLIANLIRLVKHMQIALIPIALLH